MRALFALPGFHQVDRGAEIALISIATELAKMGDEITLIGSGISRPSTHYRFLSAPSVQRRYFEHFLHIRPFRSEYVFEEATFIPALLYQYRPADFDVTLTCSYPFTNWALRRPSVVGKRPAHVFITQNGDWPAFSNTSEFRFFGCEGLVCTNPDFFERNKERWNSRLIPNGVDLEHFKPGDARRKDFELPDDKLVVLMVSALISSKRVDVGIRAVQDIPNAHLVVAGDGPLRDVIAASAKRILPGRFSQLSVASARMPALYQAADVFLHLSKDESFGNVFLEAMATGRPVVGHDSPRLRWIVGDNELLVNTDDVAAISNAIQAAAREDKSKQVNRVRRVELFSWPKIAAEYRNFLDEIVAESSSRAKNRPYY